MVRSNNNQLLFLLAAIFGFCLAEAIDPGQFLKPFVTSEERIKSHGYPAESHFIETTDGYVLNLFRIPYSHKLQNQNERRPAILLQHGLFSNSDCFLTNGPDNSLAYLLVDAGYDVWLGNARGNIYSRKNNKISINHPYFWRFSWHEIGVYDIATMIDYIIEKTEEKAIHYAGHSQGTTVYFVLMSERPEYNDKIKSAHMLAPCAWFGHGKSAVFPLFLNIVGRPESKYVPWLSDMELLPQNSLINRLIDTTCGPKPTLGPLCRNMYWWIKGDVEGAQNSNMTAMQELLATHSGGASSNQGIHYIQLFENGKYFRRYDHGRKKNLLVYGQETPPNYDVSKISAATYLYSSENDSLCAPQDVENLLTNFPQHADHYVVPEPSFTHLDFIIANKVKELLNDVILENVNKNEYNN